MATPEGSRVSTVKHQAGHGFNRGQPVVFQTDRYVLASISTGFDGVVGTVSDINRFELVVGGELDGLSNLTPGVTYYLTNVAGQLGTSGTRPVYRASTSTHAWVAASGTYVSESATSIAAAIAAHVAATDPHTQYTTDDEVLALIAANHQSLLDIPDNVFSLMDPINTSRKFRVDVNAGSAADTIFYLNTGVQNATRVLSAPTLSGDSTLMVLEQDQIITASAFGVNNILYEWPGANAKGSLNNDAAGNLSWGPSTYDIQALSSGLIDGGILSIGTPTNTFNISAGRGYVVDSTTDPDNPTITEVSWSAQSNIALTNIATATETYISIDAGGNVVQQTAQWTRDQARTSIIIGEVNHFDNTVVNAVMQGQETIHDIGAQVGDVISVLNRVNVSGNLFSANSTDLTVAKTSGVMFGLGINWDVDPDDPHNRTVAASAPTPLIYRYQTGTTVAASNNVNPDTYDVAGTPTAVPPNKFTIQRIFISSNGTVVVQPGQALYNTEAQAKQALLTEPFVTEPTLANNYLLRCLLVVKQGATDLSDPTQAFFFDVGKFGDVTIAGSASPLLFANIGTTPNAQGLTFDGETFNLEPASAAFGGVVTTLAQEFSGDKRFLDDLIIGTDPGGSQILRVGGAVIASEYYFADGMVFGDYNTTYHIIRTKDNGAGILLGGAGDPTNYYQNTSHYFRNLAGTAYGYFNSSGQFILGTDPGGGDLLRVGGTSRLNGHVGIGKASDTYVLDILTTGNNGVRLTSDTSQLYLGKTGGSSVTGALTNEIFGFITNGSLRGYFDAVGALVLGTDPGGSEKLRIGGALRHNSNYVMNAPSGTTWELQNSSDLDRGLRITATTGVGVKIATQSGVYPLILGYDGGSDLTIDTGHTVVIGTDPGGSQKLRIGGSLRSQNMYLENATYLRGINAAGSTDYRLIGLTAGDIVSLDADARGTVLGTDPGGSNLLRIGGDLQCTEIELTNIGRIVENGSDFELNADNSFLLTVAAGTAIAVDANANVTLGGGVLATTATNGFAKIPTCAGTPTGVPTTGNGSMIIDETNNRLYFYSGGAWRNAGP